ncbi:Rrf2 family transcriptional regulator [Acetobacter sp.]|jgi:Rrf2 family nitric oxide-sensitive transcriptional repressor|uniref:Rrf2 family transcriptional regulator n=1 Tax=Acetobacter sp. TaxID=440 RepID=UPI0025BCBB78|nr:Rrf2 family transcriptional regulator [Acetobacter sp.]MCH4092583.1 Rrf2 family transcriptional regulator [Acetobacter sp.]MCI1299717.1 Rrf2 family transcriptional regulator [Acetobacter sp.]MCI1315403.1 Rrf2 family transcriptional regulator [Acetobacter sp.]
MRLTQHSDYALRALIFLAANPDRLSSIREIAERYGLSENYMVKIIHRLGQGGFIETIRGRNGGLRLGRPADSIRIGDVIRFTEDDCALVACMHPSGEQNGVPCLLMPDCTLRHTLDDALGAFFAVLDNRTLADMVGQGERRKLT